MTTTLKSSQICKECNHIFFPAENANIQKKICDKCLFAYIDTCSYKPDYFQFGFNLFLVCCCGYIVGMTVALYFKFAV